ncbi:hypothetical protein [Streptomyces sp. SPB074]|uniref:hypothetical protein n=1 Tax=Streptomyces sp. (strain SPB074) TaxID=465543 RepID=UPI00017F0E09|nr:hypothetical protein [Streptomyces sp. SPB074]EDY42479.1 hypothetical protein SSBG_00441 [Streptomyces sp. SPB074]
MTDPLAAYRDLVAAAQRITAERVTYGLVTPEAERAYDHALTSLRGHPGGRGVGISAPPPLGPAAVSFPRACTES